MYKRGFACRCRRSKCPLGGNARRTLRHHPDYYVGSQAWHAMCHGCGSPLTIDKQRNKPGFNRKAACHCDAHGAYLGRSTGSFPHRRGSLYCAHYNGDPEALKHGKLGHEFRDMREPGEDDEERSPGDSGQAD